MKVIGTYALTIITVLNFPRVTSAQTADKTLTQTIRGIVTDKASGEPVSFATVIVDDTTLGAYTDEEGAFSVTDVPIGRHTVTVRMLGYETAIIKELLLTSARETYLEISLMEKTQQMGEVVVRPRINKSGSLNKMALLGAQMFSVEEASRFAGGMDDPARMVSSYAGVTPPSGSGNGVSIRGNAPNLLQWRIEGIEVSNPNHFSDINGLGGGLLSALSSNVLGNSDFFIGAFPAEYNNAISGVFDMKLRNGNNQKYQHAFQLGVLGIDFASEGPVSREHNSSYIINYRYSTTGLLEKLRKENLGGTLNYQDLNFKLNFPTRAGTFSLWGTGWTDEVAPSLEDVSEWKYKDDGLASGASQKGGVSGLSHRYFFPNKNTFLKTTLAATYSQNDVFENRHDESGNKHPQLTMNSRTGNFVFKSMLNNKFSNHHTNQTGITFTHIDYKTNLDYSPVTGQALENIASAAGNTNLISAYTSSAININNRLKLTLGVNGQFFTLNNNKTIEPRAGLKWQATAKNSFAIGYGLHSRMEKADVYFVKDAEGNFPNLELDFIKSHHFMLSYIYRITENMTLKVAPYFQRLFDVPVTDHGTFSVLNRNDFYITEILVNQGKGKNYGIDITFEKYMTKGLYYMATASLYKSGYKAGNNHWYSTKYDRQFIVNGLVGKEWMIGRDMLSINLKASLVGGQRYAPVDEAATLAHPDKEVQYDEARMYSEQFSPMIISNFTVSYKMNRSHVAHAFAIKGINATGQREYIEHKYNIKTSVIEAYHRANSLFNVSYRVEF